jgi:hypothetical protein
MIAAPLLAVSLLVTVATEPSVDALAGPVAPKQHMTLQQKSAAMQPVVRSTTECIARAVSADQRFRAHDGSGLGDLIVDSMPACVDAVRAMIDAHDRYFGDGTGEAFFMGPYLDVLPTVVNKWVKDPTRQSTRE